MLNNNKTLMAATLAGVATLLTLPAQADTSTRALKKGHEYLAISNYPNQMHIIDVATDRVYKSCPLPDRFGPGTIQISPDSSRAYILSNLFSTVYGIELDTCKMVFRASLSQAPGETAASLLSFTVSRDGKEVYAVANPTQRHLDHYVVKEPRLQVYRADAGLDARPVRTFPAPRQLYLMQAADDGSLYVAGPDFYRVDVQTGKFTTVLGSRNWNRPGYSMPDVLYLWPHQQKNRNFSILYTAAKFQDDTENLETADYVYGFFNIDLKTGATETVDFAELIEIYFTGLRSVRDDNIFYGVLNRLTKYDIEKQELLVAQNLDHTYYALAQNHAGTKLYLAGTFNDIGIHDADTLEKIGRIDLPGGDMSISTPQVFVR